MDHHSPPGTVGAQLAKAVERLRVSGSETPRLDAELLLGHVLGVERTVLLAHPEASLGDGHHSRFSVLVERRERGEPVAYIRGIKEFHGMAISVDDRVLIPRPETETLVDLGLEAVREALTSQPRGADDPAYRAWDVGTGSGAVAIALAASLRRLRYLSDVRLHLTDVSEPCLAVAIDNAVSHGLADRMTFAVSDLLDVPSSFGPADLVLANLPYIPTSVLPTLPVAASFEPRSALDGGADGLDLVRRLMAEVAEGRLSRHARVLLEIGSDQADQVSGAATDLLPAWRQEIHPDLGGSPRVLQLDAPEA